MNLEKPAFAEQKDAWGFTLNDNFDKIDAEFSDKFKTIIAFEAMTAGNVVNIFDDAGTPKARRADASAVGKEVDGFILEGVVLGGTAKVFAFGIITGLVGLTPGARQFLSTTAGGLTEIAPEAPGNISQEVGRAMSDTDVILQPKIDIEVA